MAAPQNKQWLFASHPSPNASVDNFRLEDTATPEAADGEALVRLKYVSVDPYMRGRMNPTKSYTAGFEIGKAPSGAVVAEVIQSKSSKFAVGDLLAGYLPWVLYQVITESSQLNKIPVELASNASLFIGALGMPGASALLPIEQFGNVKAGETAFVSGAAGAVGVVAGQILKSLGAKVYGSAGTDEKVRYLVEEIGYDGAFNYKTTDLKTALAEKVPQGVDVFFDNVGGETLDALLLHMNKSGRIISCGSISGYDVSADQRYGIKNLTAVIAKSLTIRGFIVSDFGAAVPGAVGRLVALYREGKLKVKETVLEGFESIPTGLIGLLKGINDGKLVIKV